MNKVLLSCLYGLMIFSLAACNLPASADPNAPPQMQTAAAQTVEAVLDNTPLASPPAQAGPTGGNPITQPASSGQPRLTVEDVTNCRSGPGVGYARITQIPAGKEVKIVGSYPNYWVVDTDAGTCWVAMEFATPSGDMAGIPTVEGPPTPDGDVNAPSLWWDYFCNSQTGEADVNLRWTDKAANESGYRVYVNGQAYTELPANSTTYAFSMQLLAGQSASIKVEAFNAVQSASSSAVTISC